MKSVKEMLEEKGPSGVFEDARKVAKEYAYNLRNEGRISFSEPSENILPSIHVVRRTLPEVWEDTIMAVLLG